MRNEYDDEGAEWRKEEPRGVDELFASAKEYASSERFRELMAFTGSFKQFAPYNAMLIYLQRPGARFVLSPRDWMEHYDRVVSKDTRPILILSPNGPLRCLYDVVDTQLMPNGRTDLFPPELIQPFEGDLNRPVPPDMLQRLKDCLPFLGICFGTMRTGECLAGKIEIGGRGDPDVVVPIDREHAIQWPPAYSIRVAEGTSATVQFCAIVHELGHLFCRHVPDVYGGKTRPRWISEEAEEFEAESVAWLVARRQGVSNPSHRYLAARLDHCGEIPEETSVEEIMKAATRVERMLASPQEALSFFRNRCPAFRKAMDELKQKHRGQGANPSESESTRTGI